MPNTVIITPRYVDESTVLAHSTESTANLPAEFIQEFGYKSSVFRSSVVNPAFVELQFAQPRLITHIGLGGLSAIGHKNLIKGTHEQSGTDWTESAVTTAASLVDDPRGGRAFIQVLEAASSAEHYIEHVIESANFGGIATTYTAVIYVQADEVDDVMLKVQNSGGTKDAWAKFDLSGVGSVHGTGATTWSVVSGSATITATEIGSSFRIQFSFTTDTDTTLHFRIHALEGTTESYLGTLNDRRVLLLLPLPSFL
jgi:hypothetical protein